MPAPSLGDIPNARTILSAFGDTVTLQDGSTIEAVVKTRKRVTYNGTEAVERAHTVMLLPEALQGTFAQQQTVTHNGVTYYAAAAESIGNEWLSAVLTPAG